MPVYEYACTECGTRLEVRQNFTDDALTVCPECSGRLRKLLSPVGVVFKGSGFYRTDSRNPPGSNGSADGSSTAEKSAETSGSNGSSTSDSTPGGDHGTGKKPTKEGAAAASAGSAPRAPAGSGSGSTSGKPANASKER
jgi:putative FmdB family regulatory protein